VLLLEAGGDGDVPIRQHHGALCSHRETCC
jgi:hypothetical protein